jgi:hypothetical protein
MRSLMRKPFHLKLFTLAALSLSNSACFLTTTGDAPPSSPASTELTSSESQVRPISDSPSREGSPGPDPLSASAWHLKNTGQTTFSKSSGIGNVGYDLNLDALFQSGSPTGSGVVVMVADDGVESTHEDLALSLLLNESRDYSKSGNYSTTWADPIDVEDNHGTAVAGIIAATAENSLGSRGVAPGAKLINSNPLSSAISGSTQINALKDHLSAEFDIVNQSFGLSQDDLTIGDSQYKTLMGDAATTGRNGKGKVIVKAAGNSFLVDIGDDSSQIIRFGNVNFDGYNTTPYTIVVGAMNAEGYFSSYSTPGSALWVSAPGGEYGDDEPAILTTDASGCNIGFSFIDAIINLFEKGNSGNSGCRYTSAFNGTSAATPMVSGVTALLLEANPNLSMRDVKHILAKTARKIRPGITGISDYTGLSSGSGIQWEQGWIVNQAGFNFSNVYGFGLVNAEAAVTMATTYAENLGIFRVSNWFTSSSNLNLSIPDHSSAGAQNAINFTPSYVTEAVQIQVNINHTRIGDVQLELTSPSGTKSILLNANNALYDSESYGSAIFLSNAFYGEPAQGVWTLKTLDGASGSTGKLQQWKIRIYGH